jgi:hypothetical protein
VTSSLRSTRIERPDGITAAAVVGQMPLMPAVTTWRKKSGCGGLPVASPI